VNDFSSPGILSRRGVRPNRGPDAAEDGPEAVYLGRPPPTEKARSRPRTGQRVVLGANRAISVSAAGEQGQTRRENHQATISGDGRFVPFASFASNLVPGDENGTQDVFVRGPLF
jgi:hypothetical protein